MTIPSVQSVVDSVIKAGPCCIGYNGVITLTAIGLFISTCNSESSMVVQSIVKNTGLKSARPAF